MSYRGAPPAESIHAPPSGWKPGLGPPPPPPAAGDEAAPAAGPPPFGGLPSAKAPGSGRPPPPVPKKPAAFPGPSSGAGPPGSHPARGVGGAPGAGRLGGAGPNRRLGGFNPLGDAGMNSLKRHLGGAGRLVASASQDGSGRSSGSSSPSSNNTPDLPARRFRAQTGTAVGAGGGGAGGNNVGVGGAGPTPLSPRALDVGVGAPGGGAGAAAPAVETTVSPRPTRPAPMLSPRPSVGAAEPVAARQPQPPYRPPHAAAAAPTTPTNALRQYGNTPLPPGSAALAAATPSDSVYTQVHLRRNGDEPLSEYAPARPGAAAGGGPVPGPVPPPRPAARLKKPQRKVSFSDEVELFDERGNAEVVTPRQHPHAENNSGYHKQHQRRQQQQQHQEQQFVPHDQQLDRSFMNPLTMGSPRSGVAGSEVPVNSLLSPRSRAKVGKFFGVDPEGGGGGGVSYDGPAPASVAATVPKAIVSISSPVIDRAKSDAARAEFENLVQAHVGLVASLSPRARGSPLSSPVASPREPPPPGGAAGAPQSGPGGVGLPAAPPRTPTRQPPGPPGNTGNAGKVGNAGNRALLDFIENRVPGFPARALEILMPLLDENMAESVEDIKLWREADFREIGFRPLVPMQKLVRALDDAFPTERKAAGVWGMGVLGAGPSTAGVDGRKAAGGGGGGGGGGGVSPGRTPVGAPSKPSREPPTSIPATEIAYIEQQWYFIAGCTRDEAVRRLAHEPLGRFLVRPSSGGSYALAFVRDPSAAEPARRVGHGLFTYTGTGWSLDGAAGGQRKTVDDLLRSYSGLNYDDSRAWLEARASQRQRMNADNEVRPRDLYTAIPIPNIPGIPDAAAPPAVRPRAHTTSGAAPPRPQASASSRSPRHAVGANAASLGLAAVLSQNSQLQQQQKQQQHQQKQPQQQHEMPSQSRQSPRQPLQSQPPDVVPEPPKGRSQYGPASFDLSSSGGRNQSMRQAERTASGDDLDVDGGGVTDEKMRRLRRSMSSPAMPAPGLRGGGKLQLPARLVLPAIPTEESSESSQYQPYNIDSPNN